MIRSLTILFVGALFGSGLAIGGMLNPAKVAGFLDLFGVWDPSLAFVMGGGVVANFVGMCFVMRRSGPVFSDMFRIPDATAIDRNLLVGAALFGIGWGLGGLCPGPAISAMVLVPGDVALFVVMMFAGLAAGRILKSRGNVGLPIS
ncbi:MAG: YeeE/YedE family protein [Rhodospirillaceae bacterium]|nr:YeeE/YedE family protein [Rhodospirillaceae bacterium]